MAISRFLRHQPHSITNDERDCAELRSLMGLLTVAFVCKLLKCRLILLEYRSVTAEKQLVG